MRRWRTRTHTAINMRMMESAVGEWKRDEVIAHAGGCHEGVYDTGPPPTGRGPSIRRRSVARRRGRLPPLDELADRLAVCASVGQVSSGTVVRLDVRARARTDLCRLWVWRELAEEALLLHQRKHRRQPLTDLRTVVTTSQPEPRAWWSARGGWVLVAHLYAFELAPVRLSPARLNLQS